MDFFIFISLFFITLLRDKLHLAPFQTHLDVTSQPAQRHLILFNLMLLFFFFHTHTNCVTLPTAGIHYRRETEEAPLQSSFSFFVTEQQQQEVCKAKRERGSHSMPGPGVAST